MGKREGSKSSYFHESIKGGGRVGGGGERTAEKWDKSTGREHEIPRKLRTKSKKRKEVEDINKSR